MSQRGRQIPVGYKNCKVGRYVYNCLMRHLCDVNSVYENASVFRDAYWSEYQSLEMQHELLSPTVSEYAVMQVTARIVN